MSKKTSIGMKRIIIATQENRIADWMGEYIRPHANDAFEILLAEEPEELLCFLKLEEVKKLFIEIDFYGDDMLCEMNCIRKLFPSLQVILFTTSDMQPEYCGFYASWASDSFISLRKEPNYIKKQVKAIFDGYNTITEDVLSYICENYRQEVMPPHFTAQESEIVRLIGKEKTRKEIAKILDISENTVRNHVASMFEKCEVNNIVGLVKAGFTAGVITMGDMRINFSAIKAKEEKCILF
jgi:DNA-binding NarL/FixJ family response regulator